MAKARVLVIDDEKLIRWSLGKNLQKNDYHVELAASGEEGMRKFDEFSPDIVLIDNKLPGATGLEVMAEIRSRDLQAIMIFMTAYGTIETAVEAMKRGAFDYVNKPFVFEEIEILIERSLKMQGLDTEVSRLREVVRHQFDTDNVIAESPGMKEILTLVDKIARSEAPTVLITGESGVGKDLIARLIHKRGARSSKPFVTINCASLTETLLENELFGHEKGAFTDAKGMKRGQFELAGEGSVYLDEIGEIPTATQVKLLQVIENRAFRRVGGIKEHRIDSLIIAATNINLIEAVDAGAFRRDLFYRLNLIPFEIPTLRSRREDIIPLAEYFIRRFNREFHRRFSGLTVNAKKALVKYDWPGNVRELRNIIERIVILENADILRAKFLPVELVENAVEVGKTSVLDRKGIGFEIPNDGLSLEAVERELVLKSLEKSGNNQTKAASLLDISRDSLRYKMKKFGLL